MNDSDEYDDCHFLAGAKLGGILNVENSVINPILKTNNVTENSSVPRKIYYSEIIKDTLRITPRMSSLS